jgi:hypothetical protein
VWHRDTWDSAATNRKRTSQACLRMTPMLTRQSCNFHSRVLRLNYRLFGFKGGIGGSSIFSGVLGRLRLVS